jgi:enoyl-CoA hydratase/carnithine racemase
VTSFIDLQIDKHVAVVTMNAPQTRNALSSDEQYGAIEEVCKRLSGDRSIRVAVWTGAGKAFCAGGDIKAMLADLHRGRHRCRAGAGLRAGVAGGPRR